MVLSDAKIGLTHGKDLALVELGEETPLFLDGFVNVDVVVMKVVNANNDEGEKKWK